jgi:hypothetical protein
LKDIGIPLFGKHLHGGVVADQRDDDVPRSGLILSANEDQVSRKNSCFSHAVPANFQQEGFGILRNEGRRKLIIALDVLLGENGDTGGHYTQKRDFRQSRIRR